LEEENYLFFFGLYAPEEGIIGENENFYNKIHEILNKADKK
jgi:hypothetical protein